ncbi:MAG: serine/threonine protein kinase [Myxococcota bacterium]|jgi:serine/threonine protein kinase
MLVGRWLGTRRPKLLVKSRVLACHRKTLMATQLPQPFGKYILLNKIALGGMAEIFRAKTIGAEGFEKEVVIKRILPHFTEDEAFVSMFIDEAKVSAKLNHRNIVQIYDFDKQDETYYIAMEYVEGKDLKRVMDLAAKGETPLSIGQIVTIMIGACEGLHHAHTKTHRGQPLNIIHRDVSPHNVMLSYNGEVKVMDFGIAKAAARSTKTRAGTVKGKCAYMSPEQARGKELDPRSDLFALGVIMWEALTSKRLFAGDSDFETLSNVLKAEAPPPSSINEDIPPEIDEIVLNALHKDREKRHASCKAMMQALQGWFYTKLEDKQSAELTPLMKALFTEDIQALREMQQADVKTQFVQASELVRQQRQSSQPSVPKLQSSTAHVAVSLNEARTQAIDIDAARAALQDATVAIDQSATGMGADELMPKKSKAPLFILLALLLIGGGIAAFVLLGNTPDKPTPEPIANNGTTGAQSADGADISATESADGDDSADSSDAAEADGDGEGADAAGTSATGDAPADGEASATASAGTESTSGSTGGDDAAGEETSGDAGGTATGSTGGTDTGDATGDATTGGPVAVVPEVANVTVTVVPTDALIKVGDTEGKGSLVFDATVGSEVAITVTHPDYEPSVQVVEVDRAAKAIAVTLKAKQVAAGLAVMNFTVLPLKAKLLVNGQEQPRGEDGSFQVHGFKVGEEVAVKISASGHQTKESKLRITSPQFAQTFTLEKRRAAERVMSKARFNAKPWARVTVKGNSCDAPCTMKLLSGRHKAKFVGPGGRSKSKSFKVSAGKTTSVFVDLSQ